METYAIGLLGWGTVGGGVIDILQRDGNVFAERCGLSIKLKSIVTRSPERARNQDIGDIQLSSDIELITGDVEIKAVLHLVGGVETAKELALVCLRSGKHVITANKAMMAECGDELYQCAEEHHVSIAFEAAVAGGIPVISALRDGLVANHIGGFQAILNGTCNYILTKMEEEGLSYADALDQAKELGYAEADPSLDVNGTDTAHKLAILARIAYNYQVDFDSVAIEGIENVSAADIASAKGLGCRIKLLAVAQQQGEQFGLHVAPTLVPLDHPLAGVRANYNAVNFEASSAGPTLLVGQGAGALPTASAVLSDLVDIATGAYQITAQRFQFFKVSEQLPVCTASELTTSAYTRFAVKDERGVLAQITAIMSKHNISLHKVRQQEMKKGIAELELSTHPHAWSDFTQALHDMQTAGLLQGTAISYRELPSK